MSAMLRGSPAHDRDPPGRAGGRVPLTCSSGGGGGRGTDTVKLRGTVLSSFRVLGVTRQFYEKFYR